MPNSVHLSVMFHLVHHLDLCLHWLLIALHSVARAVYFVAADLTQVVLVGNIEFGEDKIVGLIICSVCPVSEIAQCLIVHGGLARVVMFVDPPFNSQ